jgi:hypothetical protein
MTTEVQGLADSAARFVIGNGGPAASRFVIPTSPATQARPAGRPRPIMVQSGRVPAAAKSVADSSESAGWQDF